MEGEMQQFPEPLHQKLRLEEIHLSVFLKQKQRQRWIILFVLFFEENAMKFEKRYKISLMKKFLMHAQNQKDPGNVFNILATFNMRTTNQAKR